MGEVTTNDGGDPTKAVVEEVQSLEKKVTRDAMDVWFTASQERLVEAAQQRAGGGAADDSEGKVYRKKNALTDMLDEFQPPVWDEGENAWVFSITHAAAVFHEWGADAHEIRAKQARALAFEWPDAPDEIKEQYESSFPTVFFNSVEHPGTPAIGMVRHGRSEARQRLKDAGYDVSDFEEVGDG